MFICDRLMTTEQNADPTLIDLKTARENSGLTLRELFERTRVSVVNLEAIENGDFHLLPVPLYARNFIKTYAEALGVDSKPVLQRYENYIQSLQIKEKAMATQEPQQAQLAETLNRHKAFLWIVCIIIVFIAISFFVSISNKPSPNIPQKAEAPEKAIMAETPAQSTLPPENLPVTSDQSKPENANTLNQAGSPAKQPAQKTAEAHSSVTTTPAAAPQKDKVKTEAAGDMDNEEQFLLVINATEETWIRIQGNDKEPFQVLLKPGEKISHKAARFNMDIGNAGGVRLQFNGKSIENLGKSGQVIHLRLP